MKALKIILLLLVVAILTYTTFWYFRSNELEKIVKNDIEKFVRNNQDQFQLHYDSIEKSGYPLNISIALVNPKISILPSSDATNLSKIEINLDGKIIDHFNVAGELKSVEYKGKSILVIPQQLSDQSSRFSVEGDMLFESDSGHLIPLSTLKNLANLDRILEDIWTHINLDNSAIHLSHLKITDLQTNALILDSDKTDLSFSRQQKEENTQHVHLIFDTKGFDAYPFFTYLYNQSEKVSPFETLAHQFFLNLYKKEGKTGFNFDLDLDMPSNEEWQKIMQRDYLTYLTQPLPQVAVNFKGASDRALFGNSALKINAVLKTEDENVENLSINFDGQMVNTKAVVDALIQSLKEVSQEASKLEPTDDHEKTIKTLLVNHTDDLIALIPQLNEFGTIKKKGDLHFAFNKSNWQSKVELNKWTLSSDLYSLQLDGNIEGGLDSNTGTITIDIKQFEALVRDFAIYANKWIKVFNIVQEMHDEHDTNKISVALVDNVLTYLRTISNDPQSDSKDLTITVSFVNGSVKVGTLNLEEYIQKTTALSNEIQKEMMPAGNEASEAPEAPLSGDLIPTE